MDRIEVVQKGDGIFEVTVKESTTTTHTVTLSSDYYLKLTAGKVPAEILIEKSFEFLLERESNEMILSHFDLPVIVDYFPEYETNIAKRL
jgi:hypothetical protein